MTFSAKVSPNLFSKKEALVGVHGAGDAEGHLRRVVEGAQQLLGIAAQIAEGADREAVAARTLEAHGAVDDLGDGTAHARVGVERGERRVGDAGLVEHLLDGRVVRGAQHVLRATGDALLGGLDAVLLGHGQDLDVDLLAVLLHGGGEVGEALGRGAVAHISEEQTSVLHSPE